MPDHGQKDKRRRKIKEIASVPWSEYKYSKGFAKVDVAFLEFGRYLTKDAKLVYIAIKSFAAGTESKPFPSYTSIQHRAGISRPQVAAALHELETFNWIRRIRPTNDEGELTGQNNRYTIGQCTRVIDGVKHLVLSPTKEQAKAWKEHKKSLRQYDAEVLYALKMSSQQDF